LSAIREQPDKRGGLGIGRVAAEAEMKVSVHFDGNLVVINAELGVPS
jgi:hypothetical protein